VVRADNGQPIQGARLRFGGAALEEIVGVSDDEGRFELRGLPAGRYSVTATRSGFVTMFYGQRGREGGRTIDLAAGQVVTGVDFALLTGAVVSGRIVDELGQPLPRARVWLLRQRFQGGERRLLVETTVGFDGVSGASDLTDDLGDFRLFGLMPGTYYLAAGPPDPDDRSSRTTSQLDRDVTLYPGTLSVADARPITFGAGQEIAGLSFPVLPLRTATIRGTVRAADGQSGAQRVALQFESDFTRTRQSIQTPSDGSFAFANLPPGRYTLYVWDGTLVALTSVALDGTDVVVPLTLSQGATASGQVIFEGGQPPPNLDPGSPLFRIQFVNDLFTTDRADVAGDWSFFAAGLIGMQRLNVTPPNEWVLKSVHRNGIDVTDSPIDFDKGNVSGLEITLTQKMTTVTGRVSDSRGRSTAEAVIVVLPEDASKWPPRSTRYVSFARPDQNGRFTLRRLPPARYVAIALEYLDAGDVTNPDVLERLVGAGTRVTLDEGQTLALNLRVVPAP
jgi:protocatechuate 3,4-dioxygenase beta subunit